MFTLLLPYTYFLYICVHVHVFGVTLWWLCTAMVFSAHACGQSFIMSLSFTVCACVCRAEKSDAIQCHGSNSGLHWWTLSLLTRLFDPWTPVLKLSFLARCKLLQYPVSSLLVILLRNWAIGLLFISFPLQICLLFVPNSHQAVDRLTKSSPLEILLSLRTLLLSSPLPLGLSLSTV